VKTPPYPKQIIEFCPAAIELILRLTERISKDPGAVLVIDYGYDKWVTPTLQGIKDHGYVDPLQEPGDADLSHYVNFAALSAAIEQRKDFNVQVHGPILQGIFLQSLNIATRFGQLIDRSETHEKAEHHVSCFKRLVAGDEMGSIYKALCITPRDLAPHGFDDVPQELPPADEKTFEEESAEVERREMEGIGKNSSSTPNEKV